MRKLLLLISAVFSLTLEGAMTPDEALKTLLEGNQRYMRDELRNADGNSQRRSYQFSKQNPFATILGCADSRVSPEIVFDQGIGDLFVVRVAGNIAGPIELDSLEYSVIYLGSQLVVVLGHENCGAVTAVLDGKTKDIEAIAEKIQPAIQNISPKEPGALKKATVANIRRVVAQLSNTPVMAKYIQSGKLKIVGGYYDLLTGEVCLIDPPGRPPAKVK